jgi:hypothetical protein
MPSFTAVTHRLDFSSGARCAVVTGTQILELVGTAINNLVAASHASAMASP